MLELGVVLQGIINGILLGGIFVLMSVGLNLIFGVSRVINFAHGDFLMLGLYSAYWLFTLYGLNPYLSAPLIIVLLFCIGFIIHWFLINPILERPELAQVLMTVGLSIIFQNGALVAWSADYRAIIGGIVGVSIPLIGGLLLPLTRVIAMIIGFGSSILFYIFLKKTRLGMIIRAVAQDRVAASLMGVDVEKIDRICFGLGIAFTGLAATALSPIYSVHPFVGIPFTILSFIVVILGGLGNFLGAFLGGIIIGTLNAVIGLMWNPQLAMAVAFLIFILILFVKPRGLFAR
jgi:branched-chain amino acid transport system permease protein